MIDQLLANCEIQAASSYLSICSSTLNYYVAEIDIHNWFTRTVHLSGADHEAGSCQTTHGNHDWLRIS